MNSPVSGCTCDALLLPSGIPLNYGDLRFIDLIGLLIPASAEAEMDKANPALFTGWKNRTQGGSVGWENWITR